MISTAVDKKPGKDVGGYRIPFMFSVMVIVFVFMQRSIVETVLWYANNDLFVSRKNSLFIQDERAVWAEMAPRFPKAKNQGLFLYVRWFICQ
jgi:hypothetical protein